MQLGYTIAYVKDVARSVAFYEAAFGLERRFIHDSGQYAELKTGQTTLAFASLDAASANLRGGVKPAGNDGRPGAIEIVLVAPDIPAAFKRALAAGALPMAVPAAKPWGQTVAYVRDPDGHLVELASPMGPPTPRHILTILAVGDLKASVAFYRAAFGWPARVEAPVYVELALPDHRGLGLYQREGFAKNTGVTPEAVKAGGISGTEIYLHVDDLDAAMTRAEAAGARVLSPVRRMPWGDRAAYYADPEGNVLVLARPQR